MLTKNTLTKFSFNRHLYFVAFYLILRPTVVWWRYYYKKIADETVQIVHRFWTYWMHKYNTATLRKILRIKIIIIFKWTVIELSTIVTTSQTIASYDSNMFFSFSKNNVPANIPEWCCVHSVLPELFPCFNIESELLCVSIKGDFWGRI